MGDVKEKETEGRKKKKGWVRYVNEEKNIEELKDRKSRRKIEDREEKWWTGWEK